MWAESVARFCMKTDILLGSGMPFFFFVLWTERHATYQSYLYTVLVHRSGVNEMVEEAN